MKLKTLFTCFILFLLCNCISAQSQWLGVGFYNLENLFDTIIDSDTTKILRTDFTPQGKKQWNSKRYYDKLQKIAGVIEGLGAENAEELAILGVAEIENKTVLKDLINTSPLKKRKYQLVHYESPDKRGIDVGLLYNPNYFKVISSQSFTLPFITRNQLLVNGKIRGEFIHIIVAHWPSRRGGKTKSEAKRIVAANLTLSIIDSLQQNNPKAKIIFMGDLNDNPTNSSVNLLTQKLLNPYKSIYKKGEGSLQYRGEWFLFDQVLFSPTLQLNKAFVYNPAYLKQATGKYKGYPSRTYAGNKYLGGCSDHFPVYLLLDLKNK